MTPILPGSIDGNPGITLGIILQRLWLANNERKSESGISINCDPVMGLIWPPRTSYHSSAPCCQEANRGSSFKMLLRALRNKRTSYWTKLSQVQQLHATYFIVSSKNRPRVCSCLFCIYHPPFQVDDHPSSRDRPPAGFCKMYGLDCSLATMLTNLDSSQMTDPTTFDSHFCETHGFPESGQLNIQMPEQQDYRDHISNSFFALLEP